MSEGLTGFSPTLLVCPSCEVTRKEEGANGVWGCLSEGRGRDIKFLCKVPQNTGLKTCAKNCTVRTNGAPRKEMRCPKCGSN